MSWKVKKISRYSTLGTISDYVDDVNGFLIRVGFRDPKTGEIYKDTKFTSFVSNLRPYFGKIKIGYYFTSQAINESEAIEEAEFVLDTISQYQNDFPVFFDVDLGNVARTGRADNIDSTTRYFIYKAFSETVENSGFLIDYTFLNLIDVSAADELGATIIRKYASIYPEIDSITIDGWEYAANDNSLSGTTNVCPITVYNDIAGWESSGDRPISNYINSLVQDNYTYTGKAIEPEVYNPYKLIKGVDYNVFYKYNTNVNSEDITKQPTVIVYGLNSYSGTENINFNITPASILNAKISLSPSSVAYTGKPIKPNVLISGLKSNTDFLVKYQDNVNVGTYTVTVIGRKNYTGTATVKFTITPLQIQASMFSIDSDTFPYTGGQITPKVTVKDGTVGDEYADLDDGRFDYGDISDQSYDPDDLDIIDYDGGSEDDEEKTKYLDDFDFNTSFLSNYSISYGENTDIGDNMGVIYLKGINNFGGEAVIYFNIVKDNFDGEFILEPDTFIYNENPHFPKVINIGGGLPDDGQFNFEDENSEELVDVDGGDYFDSSSYIDDGRFDYGDESEYYEISEELIDFNGNDNKNEDYDLPNMIDDDNIYDGTEYNFDELSTLKEGEHFTVEYFDNIDVGNGKVVITGIYPFTAITTVTFTIQGIDINSECYTWRLYQKGYKYTGEEIKPVVICDKDDTAISESPTFDVEYENNINFGTGKVIITGNGNFYGTIELTFLIVAGDLTTDCICRCGEPDEDGLYDFHKFEVYDTSRNVILKPYKDYYFDNESYYFYYPYNPTYIRVYRKVTGYYNYTGELECIYPTRLDGIVPAVPKLGGISVEILFMNNGVIPEKEQTDPEPEIITPDYDPWVPDEDDYPSGHSDKWIPIDKLFPLDKDINEDADESLIKAYPAGSTIKLYNCKYYSSPENIYPEIDRLTGAYYIYNYHIVENRVRVTRTRDQINLPGNNTGWVKTSDLMLYLDGISYQIGDYVLVLKDIYRYENGTGGLIAKAGQYMYITAIATTLAWDFGDQDVVPFMTDSTNTDYDFTLLADETDQDDYSPSDIIIDNISEYDRLEDDESKEEISVIYSSDKFFDEWDDDNTPYDFLKMSAEQSSGNEGYAIGLADKPNQIPIGWANSNMISLVKEYINTNN